MVQDFTVKIGNGAMVTLSREYVSRIADRLWKLPQAQRDVRLARAKARIVGQHPNRTDAAIVALANH
jgi:hypothetical protein